MRQEHRGAAAVEFALVVPLLLLLILGGVEFGYRFFLNGSAAGAAREGARSFAINYGTAGAATTARTVTEDRFYETTNAAGSAVVDVQGPTSSDPDRCRVTLTYTYDSLTGLFSFLGRVMPPVEGEGVMRCGG